MRLVMTALLALTTASSFADTTINLGRGPITVETPIGYDASVPTPLLVSLHGYTGSGPVQNAYMQFGPLVDEFGYIYTYPSGSFDPQSQRFWNGTDACCDLFNGGPDDVGYLLDLIAEISAQFNVDPRRIYFVGHSNGGFMSYRMACEESQLIAGIASLAGATYFDPTDCNPTDPVAVLQVHGTADNVIFYGGGNINGVLYPSAPATVETWATYNGCDLTTTSGDALNVDRNLPGQETGVQRYVDNCVDNGQVELWTIASGSHTPALSNPFPRRVMEWFYQHPKPLPCPGDTNADAATDLSDLSIVLAQFGSLGPAGDLNGDLLVDLSDLAEVLAAFGESCP